MNNFEIFMYINEVARRLDENDFEDHMVEIMEQVVGMGKEYDV